VQVFDVNSIHDCREEVDNMQMYVRVKGERKAVEAMSEVKK